MIYLISAIDKARKGDISQHKGWIMHLKSLGLKGPAYIPSMAFAGVDLAEMDEEESRILAAINRDALYGCKAALVSYEPGVESWGVPQEVMLAAQSSIPMVVKVRDLKTLDNLPVYLRAWVPIDNFVTLDEDVVSRLNDIIVGIKAVGSELRK